MTVPHPIHLSPAHADIIPHSYVVLTRRQRCKCGRCHYTNELYAKTRYRRTEAHQLGSSQYVTNLRPLDAPQYRLPIETMDAGIQEIPFCHMCCQETKVLDALPLPPPPKPAVVNHYAGTLDPKTLGPRPSGGASTTVRPKEPKGSRVRTVDDLMNLLK